MIVESSERERQEFIGYLRSQIIGPSESEDELLKDRPNNRYLMGMLFPQASDAEDVLDNEDSTIDITGEGADFGGADSAVSLAYQRLPSSAGISFYIDPGVTLEIDVWASRYEEQRIKTKKLWRRLPVKKPSQPERIIVRHPERSTESKESVFSGLAEVSVVWRLLGDGYLVTVTLLNSHSGDVFGLEAVKNTLFQVGLKCVPVGGNIRSYPTALTALSGAEEQELALQYGHIRTFAIGHGCAANWSGNSMEPPEWVALEFMPEVDVKPITTSLAGQEKGNDDILKIQHVCDESLSAAQLIKQLTVFLDEYERWYEERCLEVVPDRFADARERILSRIKEAISRMRYGVHLLDRDAQVLRIFRLANRAMLFQMIHASSDVAGTERELAECQTPRIDYAGSEYDNYRWRPFQLAFQLLLLPSMVEPKGDDRALVDLIWFPTGGGKTEAYLAVAAFEMIRRRLMDGARGGGTAVIKRYTMRLLTAQQFQRAAGLICALEFMRLTENLGDERFSLGLWTGETFTPNVFTRESNEQPGALEKYKNMLNEESPSNPFQLQSCPWCGTKIVPKVQADRAHYGVTATETSFAFNCVNKECDFHEALPMQVVDEALYRQPPTLVIGTIDKFARLAWDHRGRSFFGLTDDSNEPPSLIIQDELHLISGPLGTIAGLYEAAMDVAICRAGCSPKIIAATATIRRATEQCQRLYGRSVKVFPPAGLNSDDSYFSSVDKTASGRTYVGVMGQGHTPVTSLVQVSAALCQAPSEITLSPAARDTWWTQVIYHNSKRELGKTMTLARDDIDARVKVIVRDEAKLRLIREVEELSANVPGVRIPEILARLKQSKDKPGALDIVPCTNMISVGVDVSRLGLILINGQPKTTAEYIQASSRVGRNSKLPPGIVVALYSGTKPRDRSHYESFLPYHQTLYRAVEPTSVTPYAPPALDRALHAAVVILMRVAGGLHENEDAGKFDPQAEKISSLLTELITRMQSAEPAEGESIRNAVEKVADIWRQRVADANRTGRPLRYDAKSAGQQFSSLLSSFASKKVNVWPTLNSMRHVDLECPIHILGEE
jgi:hypothetical protein